MRDGGLGQVPGRRIDMLARRLVDFRQRMLITERGLVILFPPYSFGPYALGGAEVTIPWRDLAPYLNPAAVAPIRPTA